MINRRGFLGAFVAVYGAAVAARSLAPLLKAFRRRVFYVGTDAADMADADHYYPMTRDGFGAAMQDARRGDVIVVEPYRFHARALPIPPGYFPMSEASLVTSLDFYRADAAATGRPMLDGLWRA